ncbi:MAG: hypothetical protein K0Q73_8128 [Paenibacillus sp.]|nr:hypothetical protein [Paenibacillus sp.]
MSKLLMAIGVLNIVSGVVLGIYLGNEDYVNVDTMRLEEEFRWSILSIYTIGGFLGSIIFFSLSRITDTVEDNQANIHAIISNLSSTNRNMSSASNAGDAPLPPLSSLGNSRSSINKLKDFKMGASSSSED